MAGILADWVRSLVGLKSVKEEANALPSSQPSVVDDAAIAKLREEEERRLEEEERHLAEMEEMEIQWALERQHEIEMERHRRRRAYPIADRPVASSNDQSDVTALLAMNAIGMSDAVFDTDRSSYSSSSGSSGSSSSSSSSASDSSSSSYDSSSSSSGSDFSSSF